MSAKKFELDLKKEWLQKEADIKKVVSTIGLTATAQIIDMTPVDTGRARGNWFVDFGSPSYRELESRRDSEGPARIQFAGYRAGPGFPDIHIHNSVPYIDELEGGSSTQAGSGMVGVTIASVNAQFDGKDV